MILQNISYHISFHIISYNIIPYHLNYMPSGTVSYPKRPECSIPPVGTLYLIAMTSIRSSLNMLHLDTCKISNQPSCLKILIYWRVCDNRMSVVEGMGQVCGGGSSGGDSSSSSSSSSHGSSSRSNLLYGERLKCVSASHYFFCCTWSQLVAAV